jgi:hypothetical protein
MILKVMSNCQSCLFMAVLDKTTNSKKFSAQAEDQEKIKKIK